MTAVPGLPSGQQAYMSKVLLQNSPSRGGTGKTSGQTLVAQTVPAPLRGLMPP